MWIGVWAGTRAEVFFGKIDPPQVVIDEVVGQFLTLAAVPNASWKWLAAGFLLFRVFDIIKPSPARRAERLPGGWGIMTDDVIAGAYGAAVIGAAGYLVRSGS
jgi:phosphatidylglycerophosphatase A